MRPPDPMETYLQQVLRQIRWKRARQVVGRELQNHLEDQYSALLEAGLSPDQAEAETVRQMGDPISVGQALDKLHRPRLEWKLLWPLALLLGCGGFLWLATSGGPGSATLAGRLGGLVLGVILGVLLYFWEGNLMQEKPVQLAFLLALIPLFAGRFYSSSFDLTFDQGLLGLPLAMGLLVCAMRGHGWRGLSAGLGLEFLLILAGVQARAFYFTCFLMLFSLAASDAGASVELITDGLHIHPSVIRLTHRLFGEKLVLISDSLRCAGMPDGDYTLGGQPITMKNGKATLTGTDTLAGSSIHLMDGLRRAVSFGVPLEAAVTAATLAPARAIGLDHEIGSLEPGKWADLVVLDRDLKLKAVFIDGRRAV